MAKARILAKNCRGKRGRKHRARHHSHMAVQDKWAKKKRLEELQKRDGARHKQVGTLLLESGVRQKMEPALEGNSYIDFGSCGHGETPAHDPKLVMCNAANYDNTKIFAKAEKFRWQIIIQVYGSP